MEFFPSRILSKRAYEEYSLLQKITISIVAGITFAALLLLLGNIGSISSFPPIVVFSLVGISLITSLAFPFIWHYKEKKQQLDSAKVFSFLHAFIRYCIAFNLASFGWKKLLGLQFVVPVEIASMPMNQQSGEWLTWYYFGHSAAFGLIIATMQIVGSYLLLFRNTMLLAQVLLFCFMLPLTLINIFYGMNAGALLQSVVTSIGLFFLLSLEYKKLKLIMITVTHLPPNNHLQPSAKMMVRISAIILSLLFTIYLKAAL